MRKGLRTALLAAGACALLWLTAYVPSAGASQSVEFHNEAALAANGPIPPVPAKPLEEAKEACGSETVTWGSELLTTPPGKIKVKNEWGDIIPGKEIMVSGTVHNISTPGDADIPIDHPFSADTTFDVTLDEPYWNLARELTAESEGHASKHELHMELETGAFPHVLPQHEGAAEGEPWFLQESEIAEREAHSESTETLLQDASLGLESRYIPHEGDRIAMRGRWLIDCGHNDFHGELHPITFMAFGHAEGTKTVVHVLSNAYRVTQLYGSGTIELDPKVPRGKPFPEALEASVEQLVHRSLFLAGPHPLSLLVGIEPTAPSTAPFMVCAPEAAAKPTTHFGFVKRGGVTISVQLPKGGSRCATVTATLKPTYKPQERRPRTCFMPWQGLSERIAESLGVAGLKSNEVERITVNATGGTFTITYGSETTEAINFNASAKEVQEALDALAGVEPGDITVLGGPGGPYTLLFGGKLAEQSVTPVTTNTAGLTGGHKLATVVVLRPGGPLDLHRFILSLIEQQSKVAVEEKGFGAAIPRIEANMAMNPQASCLDAPSAPTPPEKGQVVDNTQPFPYYGEITVGQ